MSATQALQITAADTTRRNWVVGISTVGAIAGHLINMHQNKVMDKPSKSSVLGVIANEADEKLEKNGIETPDAIVNLINYALTAWLARAGGKKRAKNQPLLPIAMGVKTIADATVAIEMASQDWKKNKEIGTYAQVAAIAAIASATVAVPEMIKGIRYLIRGK